MLLAMGAKSRSKDPSTQVGAIIAKNNYLVGEGYNGAIKGLNDDDLPWNSIGEETNNWKNIKNYYVVHAEANAIAASNTNDLEGATMYTTLFPCCECAKKIITYGIKKVVYLEDYSKESGEISKHLFDLTGVQYVKFKDLEELKSSLLFMLENIELLETTGTTKRVKMRKRL